MSQAKDTIGFNALLEDIFGLNIRGLRTITAMVIRPQDVATAARTPDWDGIYTPSLRVVFFLMTMASVLRFVWFAEDSALFQTTVEQLEAASPDSAISEAEVADRLNRYMGTYLAIYPFTYILAQAMAAFVVRVWGSGTGFAERLRLHLAAVIPGATFGILTILVIPLLERLGVQTGSPWISFGSVVVMFGIDAITAGRVVVAGSIGARLGKILCFGLGSIVAGLVAATLTGFVAIPLVG